MIESRALIWFESMYVIWIWLASIMIWLVVWTIEQITNWTNISKFLESEWRRAMYSQKQPDSIASEKRQTVCSFVQIISVFGWLDLWTVFCVEHLILFSFKFKPKIKMLFFIWFCGKWFVIWECELRFDLWFAHQWLSVWQCEYVKYGHCYTSRKRMKFFLMCVNGDYYWDGYCYYPSAKRYDDDWWQESRAAARKQRDAAVVLFSLFAINCHQCPLCMLALSYELVIRSYVITFIYIRTIS